MDNYAINKMCVHVCVLPKKYILINFFQRQVLLRNLQQCCSRYGAQSCPPMIVGTFIQTSQGYKMPLKIQMLLLRINLFALPAVQTLP